jgi:hypothetical protein
MPAKVSAVIDHPGKSSFIPGNSVAALAVAFAA